MDHGIHEIAAKGEGKVRSKKPGSRLEASSPCP
jgi:hypothetical protein